MMVPLLTLPLVGREAAQQQKGVFSAQQEGPSPRRVAPSLPQGGGSSGQLGYLLGTYSVTTPT